MVSCLIMAGLETPHSGEASDSVIVGEAVIKIVLEA